MIAGSRIPGISSRRNRTGSWGRWCRRQVSARRSRLLPQLERDPRSPRHRPRHARMRRGRPPAPETPADIRVFHSRLFQRLHQQIVDVGTFVQRDLLTLEIGDRLQRAVFGTRSLRPSAPADHRRHRGSARRPPARRSAASRRLPKSMAPTLSASSRGGPDGNSVHVTLVAERLEFFVSSEPLLLSSTSLPYFWKPIRTILSWP